MREPVKAPGTSSAGRLAVGIALLGVAACAPQNTTRNTPEGGPAVCGGSCRGSGSAQYVLDGPCPPNFRPLPGAQLDAAHEEAKHAARANASFTCRQRAGSYCTCSNGYLLEFPEAMAIPFPDQTDPNAVCVVTVSYEYGEGRCASGERYIPTPVPGAPTTPALTCLGKVTADGKGRSAHQAPCPTPCNASDLDRVLRHSRRAAYVEASRLCQIDGGTRCVALGGREVPMGRGCSIETLYGSDSCIYQSQSALVGASCAEIPH